MPKRVRDTAGQGAPSADATAAALLDELIGETPDEPASAQELSEPALDSDDREDWASDEERDAGVFLADEPEPEPEPAPALDVLAKLQTIGNIRANLLLQLEATDAALHPTIREAFDAGMAKVEIAREAGVSRQTVYNVLAAGEKGGE